MENSRRKLYDAEEIHNFRELVNRYETLYSDKLAFTYKLEPKSKQYINKTYSDFVCDIKSLATGLINLGLIKKRIAIISPNRYEWCVSYLAITTSDIVVVPLDKSLPANELESLIIRSNAESVIFDKEYSDTFMKFFHLLYHPILLKFLLLLLLCQQRKCFLLYNTSHRTQQMYLFLLLHFH